MTHRIAAALLAFLALAAPADGASGGPDAGGYWWRDSASGAPRTAPGTMAAPTSLMPAFSGDGLVAEIPLPPSVFPTGFPFYGERYLRLWISTEGWLSFVDPLGTAHPASAPIPDPAPPNALVAFLWGDLATSRGTPLSSFGRHGAYDSGDAYGIEVVYWSGLTDSRVEIVLFRDGTIRVLYPLVEPPALRPALGVGIEDETGTIGTQLQQGGVAAPGFALASNFAVEYLRSGSLDCAAPGTLACGGSVDGASPIDLPDQALLWPCAPERWSGNEAVYELVNPVLQPVRLDLATTSGQAIFITRDCSPIECLAGGGPRITIPLLAPGTYQVVVEGRAAGDDGPFTLRAECGPTAAPLACGDVAGGSTSGPSAVDAWGCSAADFSGPEAIHPLTLDVAQNVTVRLLAADPGLELVLFRQGEPQDPAPRCLLAGGTSLTAFNLAPGAYGVAVDGVAGASGSYTLEVTCGAQLDCAGALPVACGSPAIVTGTTAGRPARVDRYPCSPAVLPGPEAVHELTVTEESALFVDVLDAPPGTEVLLVQACDEGLCPAPLRPCLGRVAPGTYQLVVDGTDPAGGAYRLEAWCLPPETLGRWYGCESTGSSASQPEDDSVTARQRWEFNTSANYCPDACDFAMYVVVECGEELHLPLRDVESGHVRVYDVLREAYVELEAENDVASGDPAHVLLTGTDIAWVSDGCPGAAPEDDPGCPASPPGGCDERFNNRTMDVRFFGTPSACGVYRIELIGWGGLAWELFANCTGSASPGFTIYSNACDAFASWNALPELQVRDLRVTASDGCPGTATAELTIVNTGCAAATDVPLVVTFSTGDPQLELTIPSLPASSTTVVPLVLGPFSSVPVDARLTLDPGTPGVVVECHEAGASPVTCSPPASVIHVRDFTPCPVGCAAVAEAGPGAVLCEGESAELDGSASAVTGCTGGLEFRWEQVGEPLPVQDWSADATVSVTPAAAATYRLLVRCTGDPAGCTASDLVAVGVTPDVAPPRVTEPIRATKAPPGDILWTFAAPADPAVAALRLYSSTDPRLPAAARSLVAEIPASATSYTEPGGLLTTPRLVFYQLVTVSCSGRLESPY